MKKKIYYIALIISSLLLSCSSVNDANLQGDSEAQNKVSISGENGIIKFKDQAAFNAVVDTLNKMSSLDKISFLKSCNVKTQTILANDAESELASIISNSTTQSEFNASYSRFKDKYKTLFLFNESDSLFLSPYSKLVDARYEAIVNEKGEYMIGNKVFKAEMFNNFSEYKEKFLSKKTITLNLGMQKANSNTSNINYAWSEQSNRRVYMNIYGTDDRQPQVSSKIGPVKIFAKLEAWKKGWFGWVHYSTVFSVEYKINKYLMYGTELGPVNKPKAKNVTLTMTAEDSKTTIQLGATTIAPDGSDTSDPGSNIRGTAKISTRGIDYSVAGETSISIN